MSTSVSEMSGPRKLGFIVVHGSNGFSSQGDCICLIQVLWQLWLSKVPRELVRAFAEKLNLGSHKWPSARVGLPDLEPPPDYSDSISYDRSELVLDVTAAVEDLMKVADDVTFLYFNHGTPAAVRRWGQFFDDRAIWGWAMEAIHNPNKRLLFVLSACDSTLLARKVWGRLMRRARTDEEKHRLAAYVGLLTVGTPRTVTSAILVSSDENLVYLFGLPGARSPDGLALGFRIHNPMFGRQLLWHWAYGLVPGCGIQLGQFPGLLNSESDFKHSPGVDATLCNGFHAEFVGAASGEFPAPPGSPPVGPSLCDLPIQDFFPLGQHDETKPLAECGVPMTVDLHSIRELAQLTVGQVIPNAAIGGQFDDMRLFWQV
jgi:hypothetical protein